MKRVLCGWLPQWPLQLFRCGRPELSVPDARSVRDAVRPVVLYQEDARRGGVVSLCCRRAAQHGIRPGMSLAEAQGLLGGSQQRPAAPVFALHDPQAVHAALRNLAIECQRFSPVVSLAHNGQQTAEPEGYDAIVLDISGCAHLHGGEERLAERFLRFLSRRGYIARVAIADTLGAAWACARHSYDRFPTCRDLSPDNTSHDQAGQVGNLSYVPPGRQAEALAPLPVAALRLPKSLLETLDELGLRQIGQLLQLPRKSLPARFGPELIRRLDQALGDQPELIEPVTRPQPIEAAWELEYPTGDRSRLAMVLERLLTQIVEDLSSTPTGILRLEVGFIDTHKQELPCTIGLLRPSQSVPHLMGLVRMRLERLSLQDEIARVQVRVAATAPLKPQEQQLFSTDVDAADDRELAQLVERMSCHLGADRVVRPVLRADPQPEYVVRWRPQLEREPARDGPLKHGVLSPPLVRPLKLRAKPRAVEVMCTEEGGPPLRLREERGSVGIVRCWGPERIETGWWRGRHIRRDYYRIETETGRRYWVYRTLGRDAWFVQGEFE